MRDEDPAPQIESHVEIKWGIYYQYNGRSPSQVNHCIHKVDTYDEAWAYVASRNIAKSCTVFVKLISLVKGCRHYRRDDFMAGLHELRLKDLAAYRRMLDDNERLRKELEPDETGIVQLINARKPRKKVIEEIGEESNLPKIKRAIWRGRIRL